MNFINKNDYILIKYLFYSLLRRGVSGLRKAQKWVNHWILGTDIQDRVDSRPLRPSQLYESTSREEDTTTTIEEASYGGTQYGSLSSSQYRAKPLASISRTMEGKFVLDKDSEEGGFTSPRKRIKVLSRRRSASLPYLQPLSHMNGFYTVGPDHWVDHWYNLPSGIEGGVYRVRDRITQPLQQHPRLTLRSPGSGASATRFRPAGYNIISPYNPFLSPQFGRHVIPETQEAAAAALLSGRRVRSSSPTPYSDEWNNLAHLLSFSELSSVRQPSSVERSFPSTVPSSFQISSQKTPSLHGTPLNAASLLNESNRRQYEQIIRQQELMLRQQQLLMEQQQQLHQERARRTAVQVHMPKTTSPYVDASTGVIHYPDRPAWMTPRRPPLQTQTYMYTPPYREGTAFTPSRLSSRHYVNIPQRSVRSPQYLLKTSEIPLATSSPPRPRRPKWKPAVKPRSPYLDDSYASSEQTMSYTRDRLQETIGRVRRGAIRTERPHSAPILSSVSWADSSIDSGGKRLYVKPLKSGRSHDSSQEKSQELSQEQSPDSSSGFGSKNTSHQQSSSQSGQSASALGLDSSRFDSSDQRKELDKEPPPLLPKPRTRWFSPSPRYPASQSHFIPRKTLPQFRLPTVQRSHPHFSPPTLLMGIPRHMPHTSFPMEHAGIEIGVIPEERPSLGRGGLQSSHTYVNFKPGRVSQTDKNLTEPLTIKTTPEFDSSLLTTAPSLGAQRQATAGTLDVSVDDHYEFDTVLSPTPGGEESDAFWSRSRLHSGDRGLSDSEIYSTSGRGKEDNKSMEARVAAMKEEFHEYRRRQARKRSSRELESVC